MAWYFNYCAPTIPNDPTINDNRVFQSICLMLFMFLYACLHLYYKLFGPDPLEEKQVASSSESSSQKNSDENSIQRDDEKSISIAGGIPGGDENSSYVTFKTKKRMNQSRFGSKKTRKLKYEVIENVTIEQIQSFYPIVFGHFAVGCAFTIMYSPYAEQSIAIIIYIAMSIVLTILNSRRFVKTTRVVWGLMCIINCFLVVSGLLEVGQANYNRIDKECFAVNYQPLY